MEELELGGRKRATMRLINLATVRLIDLATVRDSKEVGATSHPMSKR